MPSQVPIRELQSPEIEALWRHSNPDSAQLAEFKHLVEGRHKITLRTYHELWKWSVDHPAKFWEEVWKYTGMVTHQLYKTV